MLSRILRSTFRAARRRPGFAALNVAGLALGLACCLLIALYVHAELTVDRFHERADRIVRVSQEVTAPGREALWAWTGGAMGEDLEPAFPSVEAVVRVVRQAGPVRTEAADQRFREEDFVFADEAFFDVFSHRFVRGEAASALREPNAVVLTASAADRYFGDADPLGQSLTYEDGLLLTVTGVVADPPSSHLPFDFVAPMAAFKSLQGMPAEATFGSYWWPQVWTYLLLPSPEAVAPLQAQVAEFVAERRDGTEYVPTLEPLVSLHFSSATSAPRPTGSLPLVKAFAAIALAVLLLACVNVVNLTTAQSASRAREVGVRKAVGAQRGSLAVQFIGEALVTCAVAAVLSLALVALALPAFNDLTGGALSLSLLGEPVAWGALVLLVVVTGVLAGAYPAFVLSRFRPARVLRGAFVGGSGARLRKGLVVAQFSVTIALAIAAALAFQQLHYVRTAPLGFDEEQVVTLRLPGGDWAALRTALAARPEVVDVTGASRRPGFGSTGQLPYEAAGARAERGESDRLASEYVDYGFIEMMGLEVVAGSGFSPAFASDVGVRPDETPLFHIDDRGFVLNQTAARRLGWSDDEAVWQPLRIYTFENGTYYTDLKGTVVGVVADYHRASFENEISPVVLSLTESPFGNAPVWGLVKVRPGEAASTLAALRSVWDEVYPEAPFDAAFLDDDLDARYEAQARAGAIVAAFAVLGGVIACLGLLGLAAHAAERRRREVGIRKALGASVQSLVGLLTRDFVALIAVAAILAVPAAWWAVSRWLEGFTYRIEIGPLPFVVVGLLVLAIAALTVGGQAYRAATADPVRALRSD
ncbi:MAG: ABC transporter permease [Bacteroidota bacterium]